MKKIVLMLMAMVVFGNVFGNVLEADRWIDAVSVKSITYYPKGFQGASSFMLQFSDENYSLNQTNKWYRYIPSSTSDINDLKAILALLTSAKANGTKVMLFGDDNGVTFEFEAIIATE